MRITVAFWFESDSVLVQSACTTMGENQDLQNLSGNAPSDSCFPVSDFPRC